MENLYEIGSELNDIYEQMKELIGQAENLIRGTGEESSCHHYWGAQIRMALDDDHSYLGGCSPTMADSINSLMDEDDGDQ